MGNRRTLLRAATGAALVLLAGCESGHDVHYAGGPAADSEASRTVEVEMRDIAYEPTTVSVQAGETVKFMFRNVGEAVHDAFIGDEAAQAEHEHQMASGDYHWGGGHAITVKPGEVASLTYTFDKPGSVFIGCHQPGHYQAGMKLTVAVT